MDTLPKLLYVMQALPIHIPPRWFQDLLGIMRTFIWQGRHPRIKLEVLMRRRDRGGLQMPHIIGYHRAIHINRVLEWTRGVQSKQWIVIEEHHLSFPIASLPWIARCAIRPHPTISPTLMYWQQAHKYTSITTKYSPHTSFIANGDFPPGKNLQAFRPWREAGLTRVGQLLEGGKLRTFPDLQSLWSLPQKEYWRYTQVCHFMMSMGYTHRPGPPTPFENLCTAQHHPRHTISQIYNLLLTDMFPALPDYTRSWERDLGTTITENQWMKIFSFSSASSICISVQETTYKLLSRWYRYPTLLHRLIPSYPRTCWRCNQAPGDPLHIWWTCPQIVPYWTQIKLLSAEIIKELVPDGPLFWLFNYLECSISSYKRSLLRHLNNAAKALIPMHWKSSRLPTIPEWLTRIDSYMQMDDLLSDPGVEYERYRDMWTCWLDFRASDRYMNLMKHTGPLNSTPHPV